jgi:3-isopropylmalate/(R)-2-methylmalate dehydratase small subunit
MTETNLQKIDSIKGTAIYVRGDDIDTDRIIPARYLRSIRFDGLEKHVFEDERQSLGQNFSNQAFRSATALLVNKNFGCGSSREHAPQALMRWGIRAVLGESFSEIFFGNSLTLGIPCLTLKREEIESLMQAVEKTPRLDFTISVKDCMISSAGFSIPAHLPSNAREALLTGAWDATGLLLDRPHDVKAIANRLPYIQGF